jgi:hypothetical protein
MLSDRKVLRMMLSCLNAGGLPVGAANRVQRSGQDSRQRLAGARTGAQGLERENAL